MAPPLAQQRSALLDEALAFGGPIVVFDMVNLAFDEKVILRDVSFTLQTGHTKIFLGASGAGKSTILRLALGLLQPDAGRIFVNGEQIDISQLCTLASTMVRLSQRLGLERKQRDVTPSLSDLIRADQNRGREETPS